ncbi:hypothetical protein JKP88DRAFT_233093 [Tribonema minus]|uniref:YchJ-like middle NTF2-like domain-containing protein n=1 Tax=Tribonema minus TaxID=303371 RepID=A0A835ZDT4_9STRA|nr:hypothetical protein JKP88DRAFT_233093 [Tribonema minus]
MATKGFGAPQQPKKPRDKVPKDASTACVCGSGKAYQDCCRHYHDGTRFAPDPVALLRSRYSAYAYRLPDYIMATTHPDHEDYKPAKDKAGAKAWQQSLLNFCDAYTFQGLQPGALELEDDGAVAFLNFTAKVNALSQRLQFVERSKFLCGGDGRWLYVSGDADFTPEVLLESGQFADEDQP